MAPLFGSVALKSPLAAQTTAPKARPVIGTLYNLGAAEPWQATAAPARPYHLVGQLCEWKFI